MVTHVLRYDDFSACSSDAVEKKLVEIFLKQRVPCTFGVIPFVCAPESLVNAGEVRLTPLTQAKADLLQPLLQAGLAEIALHGYSHLTLAPLRGYQEFSERMPREIQRQLIQRGRSHLEELFGVKIRLYVPPWNRLAPSTAAVLQQEGLLLSSGGPEVADNDGMDLGQLPCPTTIAATSRALATAQRHGGDQNCVGTVLHDYDFQESNLGQPGITLAEFAADLSRWKTAAEPKLISDTILANGQFRRARALANVTLRKTITHSRLRCKFGSPMLEVYWDIKTAGQLANRLKFLP